MLANCKVLSTSADLGRPRLIFSPRNASGSLSPHRWREMSEGNSIVSSINPGTTAAYVSFLAISAWARRIFCRIPQSPLRHFVSHFLQSEVLNLHAECR